MGDTHGRPDSRRWPRQRIDQVWGKQCDLLRQHYGGRRHAISEEERSWNGVVARNGHVIVQERTIYSMKYLNLSLPLRPLVYTSLIIQQQFHDILISCLLGPPVVLERNRIFSNSSHHTFTGGNYFHVEGDYVHKHYHVNDDQVHARLAIEGSSRLPLISDGTSEEGAEDVQIIARRELTLTGELGSGAGYFLYAGEHKRRAVVVKVFNPAPNARQPLEANMNSVKDLMHPNILRLEGVSSPTSSSQFITFQSGNSAVGLLSAALNEDLMKSIILGFKLIAGLSSGLNYLDVQGISPSMIGVQNFDVVVDSANRFLICYNTESFLSFAQSHSQESEAEGSWNILNALCEKFLKDANHAIYDEGINRSPLGIEFWGQNSMLAMSAPTSRHIASPIEEKEGPEQPINSPRWEYVWRAVQRGKQSLAQVSPRFALGFEQASHLNRWALTNPQSAHRCAGYRHEEITLAVTPKDSAVITHDSPSPLEICSICKKEGRQMPGMVENQHPHAKAKPTPKRKASIKQQAAPTQPPLPKPVTAPSPAGSNKCAREEESSPPQQGQPFSPPSVEPSPPKRQKTGWEGPPSEAIKQRAEQVENIDTEEDGAAFYEQMMELLNKMASGSENQDSLSSDFSETLDTIFKGFGGSTDESASGLALGVSDGSLAQPQDGAAPPGADKFVEYFDFSSFGTGDEDDANSKVATPDLISSTSTNPSPESNAEVDAHHALGPLPEVKSEDFTDHLRLGAWKEVDGGGESAYFNAGNWKWDTQMQSLDQPWAIFNS